MCQQIADNGFPEAPHCLVTHGWRNISRWCNTCFLAWCDFERDNPAIPAAALRAAFEAVVRFLTGR
jgi:hypothetical protein